MFPPNHLIKILALINSKIHKKNKKSVTKGEILNFLGVLILVPKYEFGKRVDLWDTKFF